MLVEQKCIAHQVHALANERELRATRCLLHCSRGQAIKPNIHLACSTSATGGSGIYGQLGNDAYGSDAGSSDPVQAAGTRGYESVSAGHVHTCAVANDRMAAWCW